MKSVKLIRVTSVLSFVESAWKEYWFRSVGFEAADKISKESAEFGTRVHMKIEGVLKGEVTIHSNDPEDQCALEVLTFLGTNKIEPLFETWEKSLEIEVKDKKLGLIGHFDCAALMNGKATIIDFKTSNKMRKSFPLQKAAYGYMLNKETGLKIDTGLTIRAHWNGETVEFETKEYRDLIKDYWPKFLCCLKVWKYFNRSEK
jgi:hypothetical protein